MEKYSNGFWIEVHENRKDKAVRVENKAVWREHIAAQTEAFLASGGKVKKDKKTILVEKAWICKRYTVSQQRLKRLWRSLHKDGFPSPVEFKPTKGGRIDWKAPIYWDKSQIEAFFDKTRKARAQGF